MSMPSQFSDLKHSKEEYSMIWSETKALFDKTKA